MRLNAQIIKNGNNNEYAVLHYSEYLQVKEILEDYEDLIELRNAKTIDNTSKGKPAKDLLKELESNK